MDGLRDTAKHPIILGISETCLDGSVLNGMVDIHSYTLHRRDQGSRGGGVLVYVPEMCSSRRRADLEDHMTEDVWVELHLMNHTVLCTAYRQPSSNVAVLEQFSDMLERALSEGKEVVVMGDMNW